MTTPSSKVYFDIITTELKDYVSRKIKEERQQLIDKGFTEQDVALWVNSKSIISKFHHTRSKKVINAIINIVIELAKLV